jgi:hypothetical protein
MDLDLFKSCGAHPMTFKEQLRAHNAGLILLKTDLYWYNSQTRDGIEKRICLLLDAVVPGEIFLVADACTLSAETFHNSSHIMLLFIDGTPKWIWTSEKDVELI